jgi:hypothetical protein
MALDVLRLRFGRMGKEPEIAVEGLALRAHRTAA